LDGSVKQDIFSPMRRPSVIAHRGASGYEYENSRAAFRRAVMLDADGVELDVHATRDGAIVVHHDVELPGYGPIPLLALEDVRQARLRNGETVPLLSEVLEILGTRETWIEVKSLAGAHDGELLQAIANAPAPAACAVHSFDHRIIRRLHVAAPPVRLGVLLSAYVLDPVRVMRDAGATCLWQEAELIDEDLVNRVHAAGGEVIAWTVDEAGALDRLTRLGVDGLCGNYPDRIRIAIGPKAAFRADDRWV
jgi:glycerophosphoryl diester phosphodiesterase